MLADDLTGGGDIGIQFADKGLDVLLSIDIDSLGEKPAATEVWIINTNSRSDAPKAAAKKVKKAITLLKEWNADFIYKKIDSTLRGPLGAELQAMIEALEIESLPLCAAFPAMGRVTKGAVHYINGEKISESAYGRDVACPVEESDIKKLLASQMADPEKVEVKDAVSDDDLRDHSENSQGRYFAGAAAWAGELLNTWVPSSRMAKMVVFAPGSVLVVSGSLNPVSLNQIEYWEESGYNSMDIEAADQGDVADGDLMIKTSNSHKPGAIKKLSKTSISVWKMGKWDRVVLNGGDTAFGFMTSAGVAQIEVIRSLLPGIAITRNDNKYFVLKPGGYGEEDTLVKLAGVLGGR